MRVNCIPQFMFPEDIDAVIHVKCLSSESSLVGNTHNMRDQEPVNFSTQFNKTIFLLRKPFLMFLLGVLD
jgi:hypothetical protein